VRDLLKRRPQGCPRRSDMSFNLSVRVPDGKEAGFFLAVSLPRRGTVSNKDRKVNEGSVVE
jgi:hypothetical protein